MHRNTEVTYFPLGENKFKEMKKQLRLAEKYIFLRVFYSGKKVSCGMRYWIFSLIRSQKVWISFHVRRNVQYGTKQLPYHYPKTMKKYGIKCKDVQPDQTVSLFTSE